MKLIGRFFLLSGKSITNKRKNQKVLLKSIFGKQDLVLERMFDLHLTLSLERLQYTLVITNSLPYHFGLKSVPG